MAAEPHQIDHVVCGQDRLFVIETKTWRGEIEGRAGGPTWTLRRPRSRGAITVYNPLFQNQTHAEVISAITSFVKQHGSNPVLAALSHDEIGSLALITGYPAEDFSAPGRPAMRPIHVGLETTFVEINNVLPAMSGNPMPQLAKIRNSFFVTTFSVPGRFFAIDNFFNASQIALIVRTPTSMPRTR
jgi:hypothetical protein